MMMIDSRRIGQDVSHKRPKNIGRLGWIIEHSGPRCIQGGDLVMAGNKMPEALSSHDWGSCSLAMMNAPM